MTGPLSTLRVTTTDGEVLRVSVRQHQFDVGRPLDFDPEYPRVTTLEYALGALGAELVGGIRAFAARRRLVIDHVEAVVKADLENPLTYLEVVGEEGTPALSEVHVRVYLSSPEKAAVLTDLWEHTISRLPLLCSLRKAARVTLDFLVT